MTQASFAFLGQAHANAFSTRECEVRTRQELFQRMYSLIFGVSPFWDEEDSATFVIGPSLTRADVEDVFDVISEKHHVGGIAVRFDPQDDGHLHAVFEPANRWRFSLRVPSSAWCEARTSGRDAA